MRKPKPIRERAARALCELHNLPADAKMNGAPIWQSYLPEVDAVLQAVVSKASWESVNDASEGIELKISSSPFNRLVWQLCTDCDLFKISPTGCSGRHERPTPAVGQMSKRCVAASPKLMGWMAPASTGVAMRHSAGVKICL